MKHRIALFIGALLTASPAFATPNTITEQAKQEHIDLVAGINRLGVDILFDHPFVCQQKKWFGAYATDGSELILCENSKASPADRLYTIRHEAWHVYQDLKDCSLTDNKPLRPIFASSKVPPHYVAFATRSYPKADVPAEAEAYWAEDNLSAPEILTIIQQQAKTCSFKF